MSARPTSYDGTLINAVEPIPPEYRRAFIAELREAGRMHLAASFMVHWKLLKDKDEEG